MKSYTLSLAAGYGLYINGQSCTNGYYEYDHTYILINHNCDDLINVYEVGFTAALVVLINCNISNIKRHNLKKLILINSRVDAICDNYSLNSLFVLNSTVGRIYRNSMLIRSVIINSNMYYVNASDCDTSHLEYTMINSEFVGTSRFGKGTFIAINCTYGRVEVLSRTSMVFTNCKIDCYDSCINWQHRGPIYSVLINTSCNMLNYDDYESVIDLINSDVKMWAIRRNDKNDKMQIIYYNVDMACWNENMISECFDTTRAYFVNCRNMEIGGDDGIYVCTDNVIVLNTSMYLLQPDCDISSIQVMNSTLLPELTA